jgi:adenosine deaminase
MIQAMPKIELHAHLNGSIVHETMLELIETFHPEMMSEYLDEYTVSRQEVEEECGLCTFPCTCRIPKPITLDSIQCFFSLFGFIYRLTDTPECITFATLRVCELFRDMGCVYVELRSTPRKEWKKEYILAVVEGMRRFEALGSTCVVRYLVSLDRRHLGTESLETIMVVESLPDFLREYIVGFDICGDPTVGTFQGWDPVFEKLQDWKWTCHIAEIENPQETTFLLSKKPHRLGHATFLDAMDRERVEKEEMGVELCISSNLLCGTVPHIDQHHFLHYWEKQVPICICTDDIGIFGSSLVDEYQLLQQQFGLTDRQVFELARRALSCMFLEDSRPIQQVFDAFELEYFE